MTDLPASYREQDGCHNCAECAVQWFAPNAREEACERGSVRPRNMLDWYPWANGRRIKLWGKCPHWTAKATPQEARNGDA